MTAVTPRKRGGRVSFADELTGATSLAALPEYERDPTSVPLDDLALNPHNPRESYDGEAVQELAESLRETGQLQPAAVVTRDVFLAHYPDDAEAIGAARWVVLTGNRRLTAARLAGLDRLDVTVRDRLGGEDPRLSEATLIENLHREALPPLLEARELAALVERHGSQSAVAKRVSKTQGWVSQRLTLLKLTPELQQQLRDGHLTVREARAVAAAAPEDQQRTLEELRQPTATAPEKPQRPDLLPGNSGASPSRRTSRRSEDPDVDTIARDLRRRLSDDELRQLVERLNDELAQ